MKEDDFKAVCNSGDGTRLRLIRCCLGPASSTVVSCVVTDPCGKNNTTLHLGLSTVRGLAVWLTRQADARELKVEEVAAETKAGLRKFKPGDVIELLPEWVGAPGFGANLCGQRVVKVVHGDSFTRNPTILNANGEPQEVDKVRFRLVPPPFNAGDMVRVLNHCQDKSLLMWSDGDVAKVTACNWENGRWQATLRECDGRKAGTLPVSVLLPWPDDTPLPPTYKVGDVVRYGSMYQNVGVVRGTRNDGRTLDLQVGGEDVVLVEADRVKFVTPPFKVGDTVRPKTLRSQLLTVTEVYYRPFFRDWSVTTISRNHTVVTWRRRELEHVPADHANGLVWTKVGQGFLGPDRRPHPLPAGAAPTDYLRLKVGQLQRLYRLGSSRWWVDVPIVAQDAPDYEGT